jgi:hypothetical protein
MLMADVSHPQRPEVDHHGPRARDLHTVREQLAPELTELSHVLHDAAGQGTLDTETAWTIPLISSCGFEARVRIEIVATGRCRP